MTNMNNAGRALCCLYPRNKFRVLMDRIAFSSYFENFILFVILVSCITLAADEPDLDPNSSLAKVSIRLSVLVFALA